jgi:hypothetical protein
MPLEAPPGFQAAVMSPPLKISLTWQAYAQPTLDVRRLVGYRIYKSDDEDELGILIANETSLGPATFLFDDLDVGENSELFYTLAAVERFGFGERPFGAEYGD